MDPPIYSISSLLDGMFVCILFFLNITTSDVNRERDKQIEAEGGTEGRKEKHKSIQIHEEQRLYTKVTIVLNVLLFQRN